MEKFSRLTDWIYEQDSLVEWPTLTILWWVHGDETCGVEVLNFLMENIRIKVWKVILVHGNIEWILQGKRQTEKNLNRMFKNEWEYSAEEKECYEYKRGQQIKKYLDQSEASLDLHSSPSEWSPAFVICEKNAREIVEDFPFQNICAGFDYVEPWWTDYYMNKKQKIWICVECGNHNAPDAMNNALISTREFFKKFDMIDEKNIEKMNQKIWEVPKRKGRNKEYFRAQNAYMTQTSNFRIEKQFDDFENIKKGQIIWYDWDEEIVAKNDGKILFARDRSQSWVEWFIEIVSE